MNELIIYEFEKMTVRTAQKNGEAWFCLADVCGVLEIGTPANVKNRLDADGIDTINTIDKLGREQPTVFINESNLYESIFTSRKDNAKRFKKWVTSEVLPSIRKTGNYSFMTKEQRLSEAFLIATEIMENQVKRIKELEPKAEFYDAVTKSEATLTIADVAKILNRDGIGRNTLFKILRENGVLNQNNIPYQQFVDRGYFKVIENTFLFSDGKTGIQTQTVVYQKGVDYIRKLLNKSAVA